MPYFDVHSPVNSSFLFVTDVVGSLECYQCIRSPAINCAHTAEYDVMKEFLTTCEPNDDRCQVSQKEC